MPKMKYKIVWPALERWLTENKISVNRFGQMLGVSTNTIYHYVRGFREPTLSMCHKMADITGMTMDELFGEKNRRSIGTGSAAKKNTHLNNIRDGGNVK